MIEPKLQPIAQKGFAMTAHFLLKRQFEALYWDLESHVFPDRRLNGRAFFVASHPSWFDPLVAAEVAIHHFGLRVLAPMDEEAFRSYPSLRYVGVFGVRSGDGPAVEQMLKREFEVHPKTAVWVTPTGQFWPNERELPTFKQGLSRWSKAPESLRIPTAVHYAFGPQEKPQVFVRLGSPIPRTEADTLDDDSEKLRRGLQSCVEALLKKVHLANSGNRFQAHGFKRLEFGGSWDKERS